MWSWVSRIRCFTNIASGNLRKLTRPRQRRIEHSKICFRHREAIGRIAGLKRNRLISSAGKPMRKLIRTLSVRRRIWISIPSTAEDFLTVIRAMHQSSMRMLKPSTVYLRQQLRTACSLSCMCIRGNGILSERSLWTAILHPPVPIRPCSKTISIRAGFWIL